MTTKTFLRLGLLALLALLVAYSLWPAGSATTDRPAPADAAYRQQLQQARRQKDAAFRTADTSPLPLAERPTFRGLHYFEPDEQWKVRARLTRFADIAAAPLNLPLSDGSTAVYRRWGAAEFAFNNQPQRLLLLQRQTPTGYEPELFVPFADPTNGRETYGGGRYLDLPLPAPETVEIILDFNLAYNPFCAYNHDYSCPVPPAENRLNAAVRAGEKTYHD